MASGCEFLTCSEVALSSSSSGCEWITFGGSLGKHMTQSFAIDCLLLCYSLWVELKLDLEFLVAAICNSPQIGCY